MKNLPVVLPIHASPNFILIYFLEQTDLSHRGPIAIPEKHSHLGKEHPQWDNIQMILIIAFFLSVYYDNSFSVGYSSILERVSAYPILLLPAALFLGAGVYLVLKSHSLVIAHEGAPKFVDSGVYSVVRHPMYLGALMILLGVLFLKFSLLALAIALVYLVLSSWMASYEERDLVRKLGRRYLDYQKRVSKLIPGL